MGGSIGVAEGGGDYVLFPQEVRQVASSILLLCFVVLIFLFSSLVMICRLIDHIQPMQLVKHFRYSVGNYLERFPWRGTSNNRFHTGPALSVFQAQNQTLSRSIDESQCFQHQPNSPLNSQWLLR